MNDIARLTILYDYYGKLLTDTQRLYFESYYFNNWSLAEIANEYGVSRNGVHKSLLTAAGKLEDYETTLELNKKREAIKMKLKNDQYEIIEDFI